MRDLWVVGGEQRVAFYEHAEWRRYRRALVVRVHGGRPQRVFEYRTPPERRAGRGSHCFKAATFTADRAYLCTDTEVLVCALPDFRLERVLSLPCFNDLHHVVPGPEGTLFVACTGLDAVAEVTLEGELVRLVDVLGGCVWDRFAPDVDYRRVATTKPHRSHPNYVFFRDGEPWVTRFLQRDVVPLAEVGLAPKPIAPHGIHDGQPVGERTFLTGVDGRVLAVDGAGRRVLDAGLQAAGENALGWCRGLFVDGNSAWVGFTRLRFTRLRRNVSWVRHGLRQVEPHRLPPTRVALYDLSAATLVAEIDTEPVGLHAVFSIHAVAATGEAPA